MRADIEPSRQLARWWVGLLVLCLIQFSGVWLYPPSTGGLFDILNIEKVFGVPFQWCLWCLVSLATLVHINRAGFGGLAGVLKIFMPFWVMGLLAGVFGFDPIGSTRLLVLWMLMALAAGVLGLELPVERASKLICVWLMLFMLASVVLALAVPAIGTQVYGMGSVWRGAFVNKNTLGWVAALTLVIGASLITRQSWRWAGLAALLAVVCVAGSGSKGALVAAFGTLGYIGVMRFLSSRVTPAFGVVIILVLLLVLAICGFLVLPLVLEALGRDATLTGRTDVWYYFFTSMIKTPWLGDGPGAYTTLSPLTLPLANKLSSLGTIVTPHNIYLGVLGDSGLFGLVAYLALMLYLTLLVPLQYTSRYAMMGGAVGFLVLSHGVAETHEIFISGLAMFLIILFRGLFVQEQRRARAPRGAAAAGVDPLPAFAVNNYRV